jgi:sugar O-acyltransferase (sialic acid O-acetyltransferase NeuD family)
MNKKIAIIGSGGFAREVAADLQDRPITFFVDDKYIVDSLEDPNVHPLSKLDTAEYAVLVAIGDPLTRADVVARLPVDTVYYTHISKHATLLDSPTIEIGEGTIICAGVVLTTNIKLGKHTQLNLNSTVGHDCRLGDYFTTAPGAKISGNVVTGSRVYIGTNASIKQKVKVTDCVTVGMQAAVVTDLTEAGTYVGVPAKKLRK